MRLCTNSARHSRGPCCCSCTPLTCGLHPACSSAARPRTRMRKGMMARLRRPSPSAHVWTERQAMAPSCSLSCLPRRPLSSSRSRFCGVGWAGDALVSMDYRALARHACTVIGPGHLTSINGVRAPVSHSPVFPFGVDRCTLFAL